MTHESQSPATLTEYFAGDRVDALDADADVGSRIEAARELAGMDRAEFGAQVGVRPETVAAWESGERPTRSNKLVLIAGVLGVSLSWLMIGRGEGPSAPSQPAPLAPELADIRADLEELADRIDQVVQSLPDGESA